MAEYNGTEYLPYIQDKQQLFSSDSSHFSAFVSLYKDKHS